MSRRPDVCVPTPPEPGAEPTKGSSGASCSGAAGRRAGPTSVQPHRDHAAGRDPPDGGRLLADVTLSRTRAPGTGRRRPAVLANSAVVSVVLDHRARAAGHRHRRAGHEVTVTDASRILALDIYGTLAATVFTPRPRRPASSAATSRPAFPRLADLPVVTHNGHELNARGDPRPRPDRRAHRLQHRPARGAAAAARRRHPGRDHARRRTATLDTHPRARSRRSPTALGVPDAGERARRARRRPTSTPPTRRSHARARGPGADRLRIVFLYVRGSAGVYYLVRRGLGRRRPDRRARRRRRRHRDRAASGMRPLTAEAPRSRPRPTCSS